MNNFRLRSYSKAALSLLVVGAMGFLLSTNAWAQTFGPGIFQGIIQSDSNNDESFGFITVVLSRTGTFSVRFNLGVNGVGQHVYSKSGKFDESGHYHFEGPEPISTRYAVARIIDLQLDSVSSPTRITGDMTDLTHSSTVEMERVAVATLANAAPEAGAYTFLAASGDSGVPHNTGFGRLLVSGLGHLIAVGRSADGRPFSQAANVTVYDRWPVFAKMAGTTNGILSGWLNFQETAGSDFTGQLTCIGPEVPGPNHAFVPEFSGNTSVVGSRYIVPVGSPVLNVDSSSNNVHLTLSDGGLETSINRNLTLTAGNKFVFSPRLTGDSLVVNPATGLFAGTFLHSDGRTYPYRGAILQKQNRGDGEFVDHGGEGGDVSLTPQ
ncbi:MAG: putative Peptidylprolyl isomerase [Verrucomicrobiales bacterium]|nr:putative Peptidylprolyl isomerase [Verrucomicrobiales bacterium]